MRWLVQGRCSIGAARFGCHLMGLMHNSSRKLSVEPVSPAVVSVQSSSPPPWLMLPSGWVDDDDSDNYHFFSVAEKKVINIKKNFEIPWRRHYFYPQGDTLCLATSCYGWQAFVNKRNCSLFLFNPLGNPHKFSHTIIPLPPIETLYDCLSSFHTQKVISPTPTTEFLDVQSEYKLVGKKVDYSIEDLIEGLITKIVLSLPPLAATTTSSSNSGEDHCLTTNYNEDCLLIARTDLCGGRYVCCRPGDASWTSLNLDFTECPDYDDFTYFSKDQLFYAFTSEGKLESLDLRRPNSVNMQKLVYNRFPPIIQPTMMDEHQIQLRESSFKLYHLVDFSNDLLLVVRFCRYKDDFLCCKEEKEEETQKKQKKEYTVAFNVYKFDFVNKKWVYVPDLGDESVLFLGLNSFSMSLSDEPGLQGSISGNCIYFSFAKGRFDDPTYNDSGIYNLNDGSITTFLPECFSTQENQIQSFPPPMWIH